MLQALRCLSPSISYGRRWQCVLWDIVVDGIIWERTPKGFEYQARASSDSIELGKPVSDGVGYFIFLGSCIAMSPKNYHNIFFLLTT